MDKAKPQSRKEKYSMKFFTISNYPWRSSRQMKIPNRSMLK